MILLKEFSEEDVLKLIAGIAVETLPSGKKGLVEARWKDDGGIEIFFIESKNNNQFS